MKRLFFILFLCKTFSTSFGQDGLKQSYSDTTPSLSTQNHSQFHVNYKKRLYLISGIHIAGSAATMFILSKSWYKDFPKTSFHTFNDSKEWLQVDKAGHAWT
ncbi:MAG TPA: hypothetical protein VNA26_00890, partial [Chitinophagaceae bacterium]|nr:hypothetical protein [Chitinophagaceae bacterium]